MASRRWAKYPLAAETLRILHDSCPKIKSIRIEFSDNMGSLLGLDVDQPESFQLEDRQTYGKPDLTIFNGLEELALDNLYEELPWWKSQIVQVLKNSPTLRTLALSLSTETISRYDECDERDKFDDFFDHMCDEYGATGAAPLPIRWLELGTAIYPRRRSAIEQLINFRDLEDVHIENKEVWHGFDLILMYEGGREDSGIVFDVFQPTQCPKLRRFTAAQYMGDVHRLLAKEWDSASARQLAISFREIGHTYQPASLLQADSTYPSLPLHVRMLDIDLDHYPDSLEQVLDSLVSGDDGALEGLAVPLKKAQAAQGGFLHLDLISKAIAKLANLAQLSLIPNTRSQDMVVERKEMQRAANILARAGLRLRYIQIYYHYLRVWRNGDGTVRLEELEDREVDDVELFSRTVWVPDTI